MINVIAMAELLEGEYRTAFQKIDMYATVNGVEQYEERVLNIYDMLMEAQKRNDDVEKVIGNDIEEFCKAYFQPEKSEYSCVEKLGNISGTLKLWVIFLIIDILFEIEYTSNIFAMKSNMFPFVLGSVVALLCFIVGKFVITPIIFKKKKISPAAMSFSILAMFIVSVIAGTVFFGHIEIMIPTWIVLTLIVGILVLYAIACWRLKKKGIKLNKEDKSEKAIKKAFEQEVNKKSTMKIIAPVMEKRYQRIKKRKAKRGLDYTMKDFQALIHKEGKLNKVLDIIMIIIIVIIVAVPVIDSILAEEYLLAVILVVAVGAVEYGVYRAILKTIRDSSIYQIQLVDECVSRGIALAEYDVEGIDEDTEETKETQIDE